jgi:uncharacterized membrane protein YfcA
MFGIIIVSLFSGVVSGLGMGGGTILIPLLSTFCSTPQITAQSLNLLSFIPTSIVATIIHLKNKIIKFRCLLLSIPALISSVFASVFAHSVPSDFLKIFFGIFLTTLGIVNLLVLFLKKSNENSEKDKK